LNRLGIKLEPRDIEKELVIFKCRMSYPFQVSRMAANVSSDILLRDDMIAFVKDNKVFHIKLRNSDLVDLRVLSSRLYRVGSIMIHNIIGEKVNPNFVKIILRIMSYYNNVFLNSIADDLFRRSLKLLSSLSVYRSPYRENTVMGASRATNRRFAVEFSEPVAEDVCEIIYKRLLMCDDFVYPGSIDINHIYGVDDIYSCPFYMFSLLLLRDVVGYERVEEFIDDLAEFVRDVGFDGGGRVSVDEVLVKLEEYGFAAACGDDVERLVRGCF